MSKRITREQLWADPEFIRILKRIKAEKLLKTGEDISNREITRTLIKDPEIVAMIRQRIVGNKTSMVRTDKKRLFT